MQAGTQSPPGPIRAEDHVGLVAGVARDLWRPGTPFSRGDLVGYGYLGLARGVAHANAGEYDPARGKLSTYLRQWVAGAIREAIADVAPTIRVPHYHRRKVADAASRARYAGDARRARACASLDGRASAMSAAVGGRFGAQPGRDIAVDRDLGRSDPPDARLQAADEVAWLDAALARLDARDRDVVRLRYGLADGREWLLREIGDRHGLSREWARLAADRALARLRELAGVA